MIKKIEFSAKNLTSNAGLSLLLEHANQHGIFDLIDHDRGETGRGVCVIGFGGEKFGPYGGLHNG